jgi:hypothetical protein
MLQAMIPAHILNGFGAQATLTKLFIAKLWL